MKYAAVIILVLLAGGCAAPMTLSAREFDARRADGSQIPAYVVADTSLAPESLDAVALCVMPADADPLDRLEDLAGACAAGCELLVVRPDETHSKLEPARANDHLVVLRTYLTVQRSPKRAVIVIGIGNGSTLAAELVRRYPRISHLVLLGPEGDISFTELRLPIFVACIGETGTTLPARGFCKYEPKITSRAYPASDERWREIGTGRTIRPLIEMDLITWLTDTGALTSERAQKLADRVRDNHREWYGSSNSK